ncbi:hypothetical protein VE30_01965 [Vreelandella aquamarina]|uniref:hypothetical protein n=1 Tax=Vreelandella aquamarina TaxID=77097 RepID=UPI0005CBE780|nr:hypothetical protein [Halomonas meridiana]KJD20511.1 hypothetical protein VE30_01965 [Halomonas meridiana]
MSVRSLGRLTLDMVLQTGNFLGPMERAQRETRRNMRQMEADAKKAGAGIAALAAGATAAAAGIYAYAKSNMDTIDANAKLARSLEGTIDGLRAVNMAASDNGLDGMEASLNRMNRRLGAVEMNGGPALKTVERLNLNLQEMQDMDVDEKLAYIADRIRDSGVSSQEAARHLQQLGFEQRGATELFLKGGDAIRNARQEIEDYGLSVSMMDAAAIEQANDALARIGLSAEAMGNAVAIKLAPALNDMADSINSVTRAFHAGDYDLQLQILSGVAVGAASAAGAYGVYRTAVNAATIAQWALNTAIRASPLGLALTVIGAATGVMFSFREELGLTRDEAYKASIDVDELTGAFQGLTRAQQENRRASIVGDLTEMRLEAGKLGTELAAVSQLVRESGQLDEYGGALPVATAEDVARGRELRGELGKLLADIGAGSEVLKEYDEIMSGLGGGGEDNDPPSSRSSSESERAAKAIAEQVAALQLQAATLGMAEDELVLYKLAQEGATDSQLAAARTALESVAAYEASEKAAEDYQNLLDDLRTTEERLTDQLHERLAVLDAVNVASDEYAETAARIAEAAFVDAPEYGGLDATIGGPFGELDKIDEAEEKLQEWYATQLEMLEQFRSERADLTEQWDEQERALKEEHENELARIERARQMAQLAGAESLFGDLASISEQFAGEQSGIFKAMFAAEKAFAIASAIISIQQGIANAAALPFPANIPAMASVAAATAGIVTTIQGTNLAGMAHDGIDSIPETGTWLLQKGERVTTADTSAKLDATLARVESQMNRPGDSAGAGGGMGSPVIHVDARGATDPAATELAVNRAVREAINTVGQDFATNGKLRRQLGV